MSHALLVSLLVSALAPQEPAPTTFTLKSRETLNGYAKGVEGDKAVLHINIMGGSATVRRKLSDFVPESAFRIRLQAAPPKTFADHLKLAKTAVELGALPQAGDQAGRARKLAESDASGAQKKEVEKWVADTLESLFNKAIQQGDIVDARHFLKILATRVPDERTEEQMGKMFDDVAAAESKARAEERKEVAVKEASAKSAELEKLLKPVLAKVEQGDKLVKEGLQNSRKTSQATRSYEQAIDRYRAAWKETQEILKKHGNEAEAQEEAASLSQRIKNSGIQAALHAGNSLVVQSDYKSALEWANKILSIDPDNGDAKSLIQTIQLAQSSGWGWGSGWGRTAQPSN